MAHVDRSKVSTDDPATAPTVLSVVSDRPEKRAHSNTCDLVGWSQGYNAPAVCSCGLDAVRPTAPIRERCTIVQCVNEREALITALQDCDHAFAAWQVGQIPGRPEDILALITRVRAALQKAGVV